jgi:uncharacterized protein (TIGR00730 family)
MAENGHTLVFGGGAEGLMGACARGVRAGGGKMIGVAPRFFDEPGVLLHGGCELLFTETVAERKSRMEEAADAFIALPGGIGTYEEFFEALTLKQLGCHQKPMALLNTLGCFEALDALLRGTAERGFMSAEVLGLYALCDTPQAALDHVTGPARAPSAPRPLSEYSR